MSNKILIVGHHNDCYYKSDIAFVCDKYIPFDINDLKDHIDSINPSAIIYVYPDIDDHNCLLYTVYETYFDTNNDKYRVFKVNGNDSQLNIFNCINHIKSLLYKEMTK